MHHTKIYELTNHLQNVLTVVSDRKLAYTTKPTSGIIDYYNSEIISSSDGYVFHQTMPNRSYNSNAYRYGMNGQEKDNEIFEGVYSAEYWENDSRLGRRWNLDPVDQISISNYASFAKIITVFVAGNIHHLQGKWINTTGGGQRIDYLGSAELVIGIGLDLNSLRD